MSLHLNKLQSFHGRKGPVLLIIMDGIGIGKPDETNAVHMASTPNLDQLFKSDLYTQLNAHGTAVGLPSDDDMGNSEVGHNAIGAGSNEFRSAEADWPRLGEKKLREERGPAEDF